MSEPKFKVGDTLYRIERESGFAFQVEMHDISIMHGNECEMQSILIPSERFVKFCEINDRLIIPWKAGEFYWSSRRSFEPPDTLPEITVAELDELDDLEESSDYQPTEFERLEERVQAVEKAIHTDRIKPAENTHDNCDG